MIAIFLPKLVLISRQVTRTDSDIFYNPFVILHEFYHHRTQSGPHRGTERHADLYAKGFIDSYRSVAGRARAGKAIT